MPEEKSILLLIKENKIALITIIIALFLVEIQIFAVAYTKSGRKSWIQVLDKNDNVIYEQTARI